MLFRLTGLLLTCFVILTALLAARDGNGQLDTFFGACDSPCWQGIYPGETTRAQAETILSEHLWVEADFFNSTTEVENAPLFLLWAWTDEYPFRSPINREDVVLTDGVIGIADGARYDDGVDRVIDIRLSTGLTLAELWLHVGQPVSFVGIGAVPSGTPLYEMVFFNLGGSSISATAYLECPFNLYTLWSSPVTVRVARLPPFATAGTADRRTLVRLLALQNAQYCDTG
ncbi:MAG: hypothetical protein SF123_15085 [Chloroflexota bacterium]|nr:hypothetical protein [Chloroflexota bacterium]